MISEQLDQRISSFIEHVRSYSDLDAKVSSLLTHVSIMIAVSTLFFQFSERDQKLFRVAFAVEIILYVIISCGCLFCIKDSKLWQEAIKLREIIGRYAQEVSEMHMPIHDILRKVPRHTRDERLVRDFSEKTLEQIYDYGKRRAGRVSFVYALCLWATIFATLGLLFLMVLKLLVGL